MGQAASKAIMSPLRDVLYPDFALQETPIAEGYTEPCRATYILADSAPSQNKISRCQGVKAREPNHHVWRGGDVGVECDEGVAALLEIVDLASRAECTGSHERKGLIPCKQAQSDRRQRL
jgi:hypothetical protein